MGKLVAKIVTAVVYTRVLVSEDATDEEVQAIAKSRLLENLDKDYEDNIEEIKLDLEQPFQQYGDDDEYIDVYSSIDAKTWEENKHIIMAFSIDDRNYADNNEDDYEGDFNVNIRIYQSELEDFKKYTTSCETQAVEDQD